MSWLSGGWHVHRLYELYVCVCVHICIYTPEPKKDRWIDPRTFQQNKNVRRLIKPSKLGAILLETTKVYLCLDMRAGQRMLDLILLKTARLGTIYFPVQQRMLLP